MLAASISINDIVTCTNLNLLLKTTIKLSKIHESTFIGTNAESVEGCKPWDTRPITGPAFPLPTCSCHVQGRWSQEGWQSW